jgi:chemotaxis family two-component system sensor kinase Cph1
MSVRQLEQRLVEAISREGGWHSALFDSAQSLLHPLGATGLLLFQGQALTASDVPGTRQSQELGEWLDGKPRARVIDTALLPANVPISPPSPAASSPHQSRTHPAFI